MTDQGSSRPTRLAARLWRRQRGVAIIEYIVLLALLAISMLFAFRLIGGAQNNIFGEVAGRMTDTAGAVDPFGWEPLEDAPSNVWVVSEPIPITGHIKPEPAHVLDGPPTRFRVDGGPWRETGTVPPDAQVELRVQTRDAFDRTLVARLSVGGTTGAWQITGKPAFDENGDPNFMCLAERDILSAQAPAFGGIDWGQDETRIARDGRRLAWFTDGSGSGDSDEVTILSTVDGQVQEHWPNLSQSNPLLTNTYNDCFEDIVPPQDLLVLFGAATPHPIPGNDRFYLPLQGPLNAHVIIAEFEGNNHTGRTAYTGVNEQQQISWISADGKVLIGSGGSGVLVRRDIDVFDLEGDGDGLLMRPVPEPAPSGDACLQEQSPGELSPLDLFQSPGLPSFPEKVETPGLAEKPGEAIWILGWAVEDSQEAYVVRLNAPDYEAPTFPSLGAPPTPRPDGVFKLSELGVPSGTSDTQALSIHYDQASDSLIVTTVQGLYKLDPSLTKPVAASFEPGTSDLEPSASRTESNNFDQVTLDGTMWYSSGRWFNLFDTVDMEPILAIDLWFDCVDEQGNNVFMNSISGGFRDPVDGAIWTSKVGVGRIWIQGK